MTEQHVGTVGEATGLVIVPDLHTEQHRPIYTGNSIVDDLTDFPRSALTRHVRALAPNAVMRELSTALAAATYQLEKPMYGVTLRRDAHGCQRIVIDISEAE